ncbi:hypothetical protein AMTR_s00155p00067910 [Amborella trichopoda]|uniref:Uncharacterized protein n=1 Tax=Amborella trichopoda TaxID=13333 RepID=W1PCQ8_AMBTC|nr:hypothetical protein AMTR_s00155p00067910 [Amborella trichopoda]
MCVIVRHALAARLLVVLAWHAFVHLVYFHWAILVLGVSYALLVAWDRSNTGRVNPWSVEVVSPSPYNEQDKPSTSAEKENEQDKPSTLAEKEKFVLLFGSRISTCSEHEMRCHNDKRQFKSNSFITSIQEARHEPISKAASSNSQNNQTHNNCKFYNNHSDQQNSFVMTLMILTLDCFSPQGYGNYQSQSDGFPQENHDTELSSNGSNALALESSHFRGLKRSRSMAQPQETLNDEPEKEGHVRFCEVFVNDTIGRWINLSLFHSYEHLLENLAHMFSMTDSQLRSGLFYDGPGGIRRSVGKEPYKAHFIPCQPKDLKAFNAILTRPSFAVPRNSVKAVEEQIFFGPIEYDPFDHNNSELVTIPIDGLDPVRGIWAHCMILCALLSLLHYPIKLLGSDKPIVHVYYYDPVF